nr:3-phosphoshikimate 1-carboxyvinyltransferase [uncultured Sellimonas sp.]
MRQITTSSPLKGEITVPGDKSISHRSIMFGALAKGVTRVRGFLEGADCLSTIGCFRQMGIEIEKETDGQILVHGKGIRGLSAPASTLDVGNSGTTTRLISGILSAQNFTSVLSGDASLNSRPMGRIIRPLTMMGARIKSLNGNDCAPLQIDGRTDLHGIHYDSPVASAQVKSAILLAGLYADGSTSVREPALSRNHTELMLSQFGADLHTEILPDGSAKIRISPCQELYAQDLLVPGDISSAAYFIAAALLVPGSEVLIKNVGINETRAGILKVCHDMGADITYLNQKQGVGEPTADLLVRHSHLHGVCVEGALIPTLIDEIPMIAVLAALADGTTVIRDAAELKVKETDRIRTVTENLSAMGADITPTEDGMIIRGGTQLHGAEIHPYMDHRIAMAFAVAGLAASGETTILEDQCVDVSYPGFFEALRTLTLS